MKAANILSNLTQSINKGGTLQKQRTKQVYALTALILLTAITFSISGYLSKNDKEYIAMAGEQRLLSLRMVKYASEAASANVEAFAHLKEAQDKYNTSLTALTDAAPSGSTAIQTVNTLWKPFNDNATVIVSAEGTIRLLSEFARAISETLPQILNQSEEVGTLLVRGGASAGQIYTASRQLAIAQRMSNDFAALLKGGKDSAAAAEAFTKDVDAFGKVLDALQAGGEAGTKQQEIAQLYQAVKELAGRVKEKTPQLLKAQAASTSMFNAGDALVDANTELANAFVHQEISIGRNILSLTSYLFALAAVALLFWFAYNLLRETHERFEQSDSENRANQEAIDRLLSDINSLADGDLTVKASMGNEITSAIAERINFAILALRNLVATINDTVVQVSSSTTETQATASHLAEAADHQAHQITMVVTAANEMAASIRQVSQNALDAADTTRTSLGIANNGAVAVNNTIQGMDRIREQIQETSKRIKRLGESSQEIGEIVELINDLADQTNILALNAAIQAAMAGDAGRGFAVVADEVQRLAERSTDATRQIESLVKTIQSDTSEAITSMELSTAEVVTGTKLAQAAGVALKDIESVSAELNQLIHGISDAARQQSSAANNISETMNVIQDLTTQTAAGANQTAVSIANLAELSNDLRGSVSGFKLPR